MVSVFLSYDHDDAARAGAVAAGLEKAGHLVWWDRKIQGGAEFQREVSRVARRFNLREDDLYRVISFETAGSFDPSQRNLQGSSGTGLIQFLTGGESWARGRGYTRESLSRMSRAEQMPLVEQYFADNGLGSIESPTISDIYMTIFTPAAVDEDDDHVLYSEGTSPCLAS